MKITRQASKRYRGTKTVLSVSFKDGADEDTIHWNSLHKEIGINARSVEHSDGVTHHDYHVSLTLDDISALIGILGHAGSEYDAKLLRDHLKKQVPAIVKLLACATGLLPTPIPENDGKGTIKKLPSPFGGSK
ncbi:MAG: hypothetical protein JWP89_5652 [Schlesneria sp.]|nr:hypothetical protein [Schlesneria sp.]